jgi:transcriptional regulator with XRE-family HTH domain
VGQLLSEQESASGRERWMTPKAPNEIDRLVGSRMRVRRMLVGMSQEQLGEALGITVPQVQKYEKGVNRVGASRLHKVAGVLGVPIAYFFEAHEGAGAAEVEQRDRPDSSLFSDRETIEIAIAFNRIARPDVRRALLDLARAAASLEAASDALSV